MEFINLFNFKGMRSMKIIETTDYNIFKKHPLNVPIDENHVNKIIESIKAGNALQYTPILIDGQYRVVDGQHRLEAAKALQVPIYYLIDSSCTDERMADLNAASRTWTSEHWLHYHAAKGNENYIKLKELCEKFDETLNVTLVKIGVYQRGSTDAQKFKKGLFVLPSEDQIKRSLESNEFLKTVYENLKGKTSHEHLKFMNSKSFIYSFISFFNNEEIDKQRFLSRLNKKPSMLYQCINSGQYFNLLLNIYNYWTHDKIEMPGKNITRRLQPIENE